MMDEDGNREEGRRPQQVLCYGGEGETGGLDLEEEEGKICR